MDPLKWGGWWEMQEWDLKRREGKVLVPWTGTFAKEQPLLNSPPACLDCSHSSLTYKQEAHHPPEGQLPHCLPLLPLFLGNEDLRSSASSFVSEQMYQETAIFVSRHCLLLLQITAH